MIAAYADLARGKECADENANSGSADGGLGG